MATYDKDSAYDRIFSRGGKKKTSDKVDVQPARARANYLSMGGPFPGAQPPANSPSYAPRQAFRSMRGPYPQGPYIDGARSMMQTSSSGPSSIVPPQRPVPTPAKQPPFAPTSRNYSMAGPYPGQSAAPTMSGRNYSMAGPYPRDNVGQQAQKTTKPPGADNTAPPANTPVANRSQRPPNPSRAGAPQQQQAAQAPRMSEPSQQAINLRNRAAMNLGAEIDPKAAGWLPHANLNPEELEKEITRLASVDRKKAMIESNLAAIGEDRPLEAVAMDILREKGVISAGADLENMQPWQQEAMRARLAPAMEEARKRREIVMRRLSEDPNYYGGYEAPIGGGSLGRTKGNWQDQRLLHDAIDGPVEEVDPNEFIAEVVTGNVVDYREVPYSGQRRHITHYDEEGSPVYGLRNFSGTRQEPVYQGDRSTFYMPGRSQRGFSSEREARLQMSDAESQANVEREELISRGALHEAQGVKAFAEAGDTGTKKGKDNFIKTADERGVETLVDVSNPAALRRVVPERLPTNASIADPEVLQSLKKNNPKAYKDFLRRANLVEKKSR